MKQQQEINSCERPKSSKASQLLSHDENDQVFALLGRKCQATCTTVAQLYQTEGSAHSVWKKMYTGVLCFIRDSSKKSYFLRMFCLLKNDLIWEHEIYDTMNIIKSRPYLLTFEGQDGLVALNFASDEECDIFHRIASTQIENRYRRRQERRNRSKQQLAPAAPISNIEDDSTKVTLRNHPKISTMQITPSANTAPVKLINSTKDKKRNRRVTKDDISLPMNFVHVSHVGWNAQKGFDVNGKEDDEMLQHFLNKAGVSEQQLKDRDTRAFIYDFIESNNVLASVKSERVDKPRAPIPPPVPSRQQQVQNGTQRTAPPPPPTRQPPPPVPTFIPPRGPPPSRPPPITTNNITATTAPTPVSAPPPPPPPQPQITLAPPPPPMPQKPLVDSEPVQIPESSPNDSRNALMESIRKGTTLKKVDQAALSTGSSDSRSDLMSEIRQGIELRSAQNRELPAGSNRTSSTGGTDALADALRRALQDRGRVIHSSDDDSDESSDNDGEWED